MIREHKASIKTIAAKAGVHYSTVSRVLNGSRLISPEITRHILETARALGRATQKIAPVFFVLPDRGDSLRAYSLNVINALFHESLKRDIPIEFTPRDELHILDDRFISGVITMDFALDTAKIWGQNSNIPMVRINIPGSRPDGISSVYSNEVQGIESAVEHLRSFGHEQIGLIISYVQTRGNELRRKTFERLVPDGKIETLKKDYDIYGSMYKLVHSRVTGIICSGESQAYMAAAAAARIGKVPEDFSLICWDSDLCNWMTPPMTALRQNVEAITASAFDILEAQWNGNPVPPEVIHPYSLIVRESVSFPPSKRKTCKKQVLRPKAAKK